MKINLDYTIKNLVRENLLYIFTFFTLIAILLSITFLFLERYQENNNKINSLVIEIANYNKKKEQIDFKNSVISSEFDLDHINSVLNLLIPTKEDYFSIISTLENLSLQTGFLITSYNIVVDNSTPEKLSIVIEGEGDPNAFLEFLKIYNFSGGRLITIDKIDFSKLAFTGGKINVNVYTGKATSTKRIEDLSEVNTQLIEDVLSKVQVELKSEDTNVNEYTTKSNPF